MLRRPVDTPNLDRLARGGLRYNNFHTTALCSPSRAVLLTGRNHHSVGLAAITEAATGFPGSYGSIPKSAATIAEVLKQNGYNTMAVGKWHLTPYTAYTAAGPFDRWPLGMGFEKFYGFLGGETDQWAPLLVQDNQFIDTPTRGVSPHRGPRGPGHRLHSRPAAGQHRPALLHVPPARGLPRAPACAEGVHREVQGTVRPGLGQGARGDLRAPEEAGHHPADALLTARDPLVQPWDALDDTQKTVYCPLQEAFAGMLDHADHHIGRLLAALEEIGLRENTLIIVVSDNGASQEGLQHGVTNTDRYRNYFPETVEEMTQLLDEIGGPGTDPLYPMGWSLAGNAPFKKWKQDTHDGSNTDPFIVSWPAKIKDAGAIRTSTTTSWMSSDLLEVIGMPGAASVNGVAQMPLPGVSMAYTFDDGEAPTRKQVQYYEMLGSRAIWADGWTAVAWHKKDTSWEDDDWELYHTDQDLTQATTSPRTARTS